ncbi:hypothetical protein JXB27_04515 [Candidatus Woesearchaeota archaeon]|nr:hypothetical protein [Candidatus Woesearchaeota archaeon]
MTLVSTVKYEPKIKSLEPTNISPKKILEMVQEIRIDMNCINPKFNPTLKDVLKIIEKGEYELQGAISTRIDFSAAKDIIEIYRRYSEGGCQSCVSLRFDYKFDFCGIKEPDSERTKRQCGYGEGFSPTVKKHYKKPCDDWKPRFAPKLEELLKEAPGVN